MFESFESYKYSGILTVIFLSVISIAISGIFFGVLYFTLDSVNTSLLSTDCVINNNTLVTSCQDLFQLAVYPFLLLKDTLVWISFFFIFALVIGMLVLGYQAGKSPVLTGYLFVVVIAMTYLSLHISNIYSELLINPIFLNMMVNFTVYNAIMLNFPWFVFILSILTTLLGIVNYQKTSVNSVEDAEALNY